jgi:ATP-binding cassette subfamily E protein 1
MRNRIAVLDRYKCQPMKCSIECYKYCPKVRTGDETIVFDEDGRPIISEELCEGCGICIKKCPFGAISVVGLPEELQGNETHRYGINMFTLYGLPIPKKGKVTGILGVNGTGKTTAMKILSGMLRPNLGTDGKSWDEIIKRFAGSELQEYLRRLNEEEIKISYKPQYVDLIPKIHDGTVADLLSGEKLDAIKVDLLTREFELKHVLDRKVSNVSGGELQRIAIIACMAKDADFYFFDEITPYLDINQRMRAAKLIKELSTNRTVIVVEHDLAILDLLADAVHISYGTPGVYGVITRPKGTRVGINEYLGGYLSEENIRIRTEEIKFDLRAPKLSEDRTLLLQYESLTKDFDGFKLDMDPGEIDDGEVIGIVGPNGIGKSTFVKILAGIEEPSLGRVNLHVKISYKPQYIKAKDMLVEDLSLSSEMVKTLRMDGILNSNMLNLSGGDLQMVAIAACLGEDVELYILDEPSAHLDAEQRALVAKAIRKYTKSREVSSIVVDHDIYMIDLISDKLMVFSGEPSIYGRGFTPLEMRGGMNTFLRGLEVTFRRDVSGRPRINKLGSKKDTEQKKRGEYYFL